MKGTSSLSRGISKTRKMELTLKRDTFTHISTIGKLSIGDEFQCFILEDYDRGLTDDWTITEINQAKKDSITCIPYGRYQIVITHSPRFKRLLPLLLNVKGFIGIRIHPGNYSNDTEGCLLPGTGKTKDMVTQSAIAFHVLYCKIEAALKKEKVFINIIK